ncbi:MAG: hypothetical protein KAW45_07195 [Thermoplasmatales archaeon]|nr:hypothetical protein [Thermoplasmatales archaeon]
MNKKIVTICIFVVFMLTAVTLSSAISTNKTDILLRKQLTKHSSTFDNITFEIITDKKEYKLREPVNISFKLTNTGGENITITTPDTKTHDFIVLKSWFKRYQWSDGKSFHQTVTKINISAGETIFWNHTWNQKGKIFNFMPLIFRRQVRPGSYCIIGIIPEMICNVKYIAYTYVDISR